MRTHGHFAKPEGSREQKQVGGGEDTAVSHTYVCERQLLVAAKNVTLCVDLLPCEI